MHDGDLVFYVKLALRPEFVSDWKAAVTTVIESMSREASFVSCSLQQDASDPMSYTLYERWREPSVEAFVRNQFEGKEYRRAYETNLPTWLSAPRATSVLWHIQEWRREPGTG